MKTCVGAACLALVVLLPLAAVAQGSAAVMLDDPAPPSWDASGHVSWLAVNKGEVAPRWNRWYDVATIGASVGRFFGPHVKLEFDTMTSTAAQVYVEGQITVPPQPYPVYYAQPQRFRTTTISAGVSYQFFDNHWFHPVAGAGVESARETRTIDSRLLGPPSTAVPVLDPPGRTVSWRHRPFADVGFKWFVSERTFIRSDVRTTFEPGGVGQVSWRSGFGVDF
jgi:hypothetical protein